MKLVHIAGDSYYVPGLTNVGVYRDCVVDPGKNENVDWARPETSFGRNVSTGLITHGHNDHFWHAADLQSRGAKIYAPRGERPMIENIDVHMGGFFLWTRPPEGMKPWYFRGTPCRLDGIVEGLDMPLKIIPLAGHTDWHTGYMTPDGVLMAGDSIVDKKVWDKTGIVYNTNIPGTRQTLRKIMDMDADFVLPAHARAFTKDEAIEQAEGNLRGLDRLERTILDALDRRGVSTEDVVCKVSFALNLRDVFNDYLVCETEVLAFLFALEKDGAVDYELKGHKVLWRAR
ncbi:MAG TPA: MBL fold metallo-hydrolase [Methanocella sp.]|uniref:MBL fold metallo-hydrolase n=1 Tax=Methanocella sp. TaxID=2052833 RepID=UPI002C3DC611|nr:MBL fold metallo-hydrolase [Methanocella sp.]HTY92054.1 MBL fold metallo-hydrolase [Methanocella sp.]